MRKKESIIKKVNLRKRERTKERKNEKADEKETEKRMREKRIDNKGMNLIN